MPMLGPTELIIILLICVIFVMPVAAWVRIYRQGGETRDLVFWGVLILIFPLIGPVAAFLFYRPRAKEKRD